DPIYYPCVLKRFLWPIDSYDHHQLRKTNPDHVYRGVGDLGFVHPLSLQEETPLQEEQSPPSSVTFLVCFSSVCPPPPACELGFLQTHPSHVCRTQPRAILIQYQH